MVPIRGGRWWLDFDADPLARARSLPPLGTRQVSLNPARGRRSGPMVIPVAGALDGLPFAFLVPSTHA
jgi:hypothetical protein